LQIYNGLTPDLYAHSSHTSWGWITMILSIALNILDVARFLLRFTRFGPILEAKLDKLNFSSFIRIGQDDVDEGKTFSIGEDDEEEEGEGAEENHRLVSSPTRMDSPHTHFTDSLSHSPERHPHRQMSSFSDSDTVFDSQPLEPVKKPVSRLRRFGRLASTLAERILVVLAYVEVCSGVAVWTGAGRERYLNVRFPCCLSRPLFRRS
jgi:hypothetical protein